MLLLLSLALAGPALEVDSEVPVEVQEVVGRTFNPVCTAPCTVPLPPDQRVRLKFGGNGVLPTYRNYKLSASETQKVFVKPGSKGANAVGLSLMAVGLVGVTAGSVLNVTAAESGGSGIILPAASLGVSVVALPFVVAGSTKVKRK